MAAKKAKRKPRKKVKRKIKSKVEFSIERGRVVMAVAKPKKKKKPRKATLQLLNASSLREEMVFGRAKVPLYT